MLQLLVEMPPGAYAPRGPNVALTRCIPAPAISQELSLGSCGEQLGVAELIPESSVERFCKAVLRWGSRLDVGRATGVTCLAPVL